MRNQRKIIGNVVEGSDRAPMPAPNVSNNAISCHTIPHVLLYLHGGTHLGAGDPVKKQMVLANHEIQHPDAGPIPVHAP